MQKSKRQLAAHSGPALAMREGEFDPLWSRPPAPTLEAAVSVTRLPEVTCLVTCVGHQAKAPQLFSLTQPPRLWLLGGLSCSRCHLSSLTPVRAKCRPLGLSRSPLTPRGCTPINSALLASACTEVFPPGSPGPHPRTGHTRPAAGSWPLLGICTQGRWAGGGEGRLLQFPLTCQHAGAPPRKPLLCPVPGPQVRGGPVQVQGEAVQGLVRHPAGVRRGNGQAEGPGGGRPDAPGEGSFPGSPAGWTPSGVNHTCCEAVPFAVGRGCSFPVTECPCVVDTCNSWDGIVYTALSLTLLVCNVLLQLISECHSG